MTDVKATTVNATHFPPVANTALSAQHHTAMTLPSGGNVLPAEDASESLETVSTIDIADVDAMTDTDIINDAMETDMNGSMQSIQRDFYFDIDKESGLMAIIIKDQGSGELIRHISEDVFLSLAQNLVVFDEKCS